MWILNKNKISTFWGWVTVEKQEHSTLSPFFGSNKKKYYIEGLVVFYGTEIRIKHLNNDCWRVIHNQHVTPWHKVNAWEAPTPLILRDYFRNGQKGDL